MSFAERVGASPVAAGEQAATRSRVWLFGAQADWLIFGVPALVPLAVLALWGGPAQQASSAWVWVTGVLLVDVAHVWSTLFVTYADGKELRRRKLRYAGVPVLSFALGVGVYAWGGAEGFWRVLAYVAVYHFVRQQFGFMALYRARQGDRSVWGRRIDAAAIYLSTLYPMVWWHTHLPRRFSWFMPGDFLSGLPAQFEWVFAVAYVGSIGAYVGRAALQAYRSEPVAWGKHLLLTSTAATWYVGIVATNSDVAFTLCNVFTHGIPYAALVFGYGRFRSRQAPVSAALASGKRAPAQGEGPSLSARVLRAPVGMALAVFVVSLWLLAVVEEMLWDRAVWHEQSHWFGSPWSLEPFLILLVPLLSVPQLTHYILDGMLWRKGEDPTLREWLRSTV